MVCNRRNYVIRKYRARNRRTIRNVNTRARNARDRSRKRRINRILKHKIKWTTYETWHVENGGF